MKISLIILLVIAALSNTGPCPDRGGGEMEHEPVVFGSICTRGRFGVGATWIGGKDLEDQGLDGDEEDGQQNNSHNPDENGVVDADGGGGYHVRGR